MIGKPKVLFVLGKLFILALRVTRLPIFVILTILLSNTGGPAAGKGMFCKKLVQEFGYTHISMGEIMRKEMNTVSESITY